MTMSVRDLLAVEQNELTAVYRFFDADGQLLYVGMTKDLKRRWAQHVATQPWWPQVASQKTEWFDTRDEAAKAEDAAIRDENPLHNVHSTPKHGANLSEAFQRKKQREAEEQLRRVRREAGTVNETYHVLVRKEDPWWVAVVDGVGATETRTIANLDETVRDLVVVARDLDDPAGFDLTWSYDLPPEAATALADYQESRKAYKAAEERYEATAKQAAVSLGRTGVSVRDAAQLMRMSYQRVAQLRAKGKARRASC